MKFEDTPHSKVLSYHKIEMAFGDFFLCEKFIISEIKAEVHFDWLKIQLIFKEIIDFYEVGASLGYISNRIHSYSIDPRDWVKVNEADSPIKMVKTAIVSYNYMTSLNATLEKRFSAVEIKSCLNLDEAIDFILS